MRDVSVRLLWIRSRVDGVGVPIRRLAAEEGARARQAARARARPPAAPRAGDGRALARPGPSGGREQPSPGGARRAARARRRGDRTARRGALPQGRGRRRPARAGGRARAPCRGRRPPTGPRSRSTAASCCRRTATTTGRRTGATSSSARRRARGRARRSRLGDGAVRACPADASSFVGRGRELAELRSLLRRTRLLTLVRHGRRRQDAARARARPRRRGVVRRGRRARRARCPDRRTAGPGGRRGCARRAARSPAQELVEAVIDFLAPRTLLLVLDNCEHLLGGDGARSPTRCSAPRPS